MSNPVEPESVSNLFEYIKFFLLIAGVAIVGFIRGKFYSKKTPVKMPNISKPMTEAEETIAKAAALKAEAEAAKKAGEKKVAEALKLEQEAREKAKEAQALIDEAKKIEEEIKTKKAKLAELEKQNAQINDPKNDPKTIEEIDNEFKKDSK